jgi:hypothetical protein
LRAAKASGTVTGAPEVVGAETSAAWRCSMWSASTWRGRALTPAEATMKKVTARAGVVLIICKLVRRSAPGGRPSKGLA